MEEASRSTLRYRPELDGLRAVAVTLVIIHHVAQPHRFAGFLGVDVFFVLSGYLITTILVGEISRTGAIRLSTFYAKRMLRLYPALVTMLVVTFPLFVWLGGGLTDQIKRTLVAATYTSNLYMTYRHRWLGLDSHTWSLALEEQYYLVWPLLLLIAFRVGLRTNALAGLLVVAAGGASVFAVRDYSLSATASTFPIQSTCGGLLLGSALALLFVGGGLSRFVKIRSWLGYLGTSIMVVALVTFSVTTAIPDGAYVPVAVVATALVIAQATFSGGSDPISRGLSRPPLVWLGRISYGVYLWHYPIVLLCAKELPGVSPWLRFLIVAPVAVGLAYASFVLVEKPFLRMKDRLGRDRRVAAPVVVAGESQEISTT